VRALRAIGRGIKWVLAAPFRILESMLVWPIHQLRGEVTTFSSASVESISYLGAEVRSLAFSLDQQLPKLAEEVAAIRRALGIDQPAAVVEAPFAFRNLAAIDPPARVLRVGGGDGSLCLSLASMGYRVTLLDPDAPAFEHPSLEVVTQRLQDWNGDAGRFDAILCAPALDAETLGRLGELLEPGGLLIASVPHGAASELLSGWEVKQRAVFGRSGDSSWVPVEDGAAGEDAFALVAARPQG
jgi:hypothetical protein